MPRGLHARLCHAFLVTIILIIELAEVIGGDAHEGDSGCDRDDDELDGGGAGGDGELAVAGVVDLTVWTQRCRTD